MTNNNEKRDCHRYFPVNLKGSLMLLKNFLDDGTKKNSTVMVLKSLKRFLNNVTKNVPQWWY